MLGRGVTLLAAGGFLAFAFGAAAAAEAAVPQARLLAGGRAVPPPSAPPAVKEMIQAANHIRHRPYRWGGGHRGWRSRGYDCSGSVSYVLHAAGLLDWPLASTGFMRWGGRGPGSWVRIYANAGHVYAVIPDEPAPMMQTLSGGAVHPGNLLEQSTQLAGWPVPRGNRGRPLCRYARQTATAPGERAVGRGRVCLLNRGRGARRAGGAPGPRQLRNSQDPADQALARRPPLLPPALHPTGASWINLVERWFAELSARKH